MKKSMIVLLFVFAIGTFAQNIVFAQASIPIEMGIDTQNLDFGKVIVGTTKSLPLRIGNASNLLNSQPLLISWSTINQPFSITPVGPFVLQSGQVKLFTITFKPTAISGYNLTNTLYNNATTITDYSTNHAAINGGPQLSIHFIGIGIDKVAVNPRQTLEKR